MIHLSRLTVKKGRKFFRCIPLELVSLFQQESVRTIQRSVLRKLPGDHTDVWIRKTKVH